MKEKSRNKTRLITKKISEIMSSQWAWYGILWSIMDNTPVLMVMMNHL